MTGGGGGSSSSSSSTEQYDQRIAASDQAVVIKLDTGATVNLTDPQAWEHFDVGVDAVTAGLEAAIGFADKRSDQANELVMEVLKQQQTEDRQNFVDFIKWGVVGLAVWQLGKGLKG